MKFKTYDMSLAGLVLTIGVIVLGIVDLVLVLFTGTGTSVSNFLVARSWNSPAMVFAFGFVAGHLFGGMKPVPERNV